MHRKLIALLLICALICVLFAGCKQEQTAPTAAPQPEKTIPTTTEPAPTEPTEPESTEPAPTEPEPTEPEPTEPEPEPVDEARESFYHYFWELDPETTDAWLAEHPEYFANGYAGISINEAWLNDKGLDLYTIQGHQVLAIDASELVLIVRATVGGSRATMAIAKDPSRLHLYPSSRLGAVGEKIGSIASSHNGLIALTGSGFDDPNFAGNGGKIAGWCRAGGKDYGKHMGSWCFRFELHEDNWATLSRANSAVADDVTDAMEFEPALLKDGKLQDPTIWTGENPRACLGQNRRGEILMFVVEGRLKDSPGCSVVDCAKFMQQYEGWTALNMDGGTTAILWYRGQPITRCSNRNTPDGRYLPNAWVYVKKGS